MKIIIDDTNKNIAVVDVDNKTTRAFSFQPVDGMTEIETKLILYALIKMAISVNKNNAMMVMYKMWSKYKEELLAGVGEFDEKEGSIVWLKKLREETITGIRQIIKDYDVQNIRELEEIIGK